MATFKFYLNNKTADRTGIHLLVRFGSQGKMLKKLGTGISVDHPKRTWDEKKQRLKSSASNAQTINARLATISSEAERLFVRASEDGVESPLDYIKEMLSKLGLLGASRGVKQHMAAFSAPEALSLFDLTNQFLDGKKDRYALGTLKSYRTSREHVLDLDRKRGKAAQVDEIDLTWVDDFTQYLRRRGLMKNSRRKTFKNIKSVLNWGSDRGLVNNHVYRDAIKLGNEVPPEHIALTLEEVKLIESLDLGTVDTTFDRHSLELARRMFLASCYSAARFSDLHQLCLSSARGEHILIRPSKSKKDVVNIPISPGLRRVLELVGEDQLPYMSNQKYNPKIKELGRLSSLDRQVHIVRDEDPNPIITTMPLYQAMSSHTCRRTCITILLRMGFPQEVVMKISGHKDERSFRKYVKMTEADTLAAVQSAFV